MKNKLSKLYKEFCKENLNIKLIFNAFKIKNYFSYKDPIPDDLKSFLVYKFTCASCSSSYIGETCCHFKTRIEEHNKSHIFKDLHSTATCFDSDNSLSFKIIDKTISKFGLKFKEALHINWRKPNLNAPFYYSFCTPPPPPPPPFFFRVFVFFGISLSCIIFIISGTYRHHLLS